MPHLSLNSESMIISESMIYHIINNQINVWKLILTLFVDADSYFTGQIFMFILITRNDRFHHNISNIYIVFFYGIHSHYPLLSPTCSN